MTQSRPIRYVVQFYDQPSVGYNVGLGARSAKEWAMWTAKAYGGQVVVEFTDGTAEVIRGPNGFRSES